MSFRSPSMNHLYLGSPARAWFPSLYGVLERGPGLIHFLPPDGGAQSIAGLGLTHHQYVVIAQVID